MGVDYSIGNDYHSWMARLSLKDYSNDDAFWSGLLTKAKNIDEETYPFPRLINEIAYKFPQNFRRMLRFVVDYLKFLPNAESNQTLPPMVHNQLSAACSIATTCFMVIIRDSRFHSLLEEFEPELAQILPEFVPDKPKNPEATSQPAELPKEPERQEPELPIINEVPEIQQDNEEIEITNMIPEAEQPRVSEKPKKSLVGEVMEVFIGNEKSLQGYGSPNLKSGGEGIDLVKPSSSADNSVLTEFIHFIITLLFKSHLGQGEEGWFKKETILERKTRFCLIHSLLEIVNFGFFSRSIRFWIFPSELPAPLFLESVCQGNRRILSAYAQNPSSISTMEINLQRTCLTLANILSAHGTIFRSSWGAVPPSVIGSAFILRSPSGISLSIDPESFLASESLSLLYVAAQNNHGFAQELGEAQLSNSLIVGLLYVQEVTYEKVGYCFVQTLVLLVLEQLLLCKEVGEQLEEPFVGSLQWSIRPHRGNHLDLLVEVILSSCEAPVMELAARVFRAASLYLPSNEISLYSAVFLCKFFSSCGNEKAAGIFLEAWSNFLRKAQEQKNNMIILTLQAGTLKAFKNYSHLPAYQNIHNVIGASKPFFSGKKKIDIKDVWEIIDQIDITATFSNQPLFTVRENPKFEEISGLWNDWCDYLFERCFGTEIDRLESLDRYVEQTIHPPVLDFSHLYPRNEPEGSVNMDGADGDI